MLPLIVAYATWATVEILKLRQKVFGVHHTNGLTADVEALKRWREEFRAAYPGDLRKATHDAVDRTTAPLFELGLRVRELENKRP